MPSVPIVAHGQALVQHNYGSKCRLAPVSSPFATSEPDAVPPIRSQFFYLSPIPIDDPLSTATIPAATDAKSIKGILRPFSEGDNNALEKAWLSLASEDYCRNHRQARRNRSPSPSLTQANNMKLQEIINNIAASHIAKHTRDSVSYEVVGRSSEDALPSSEPARRKQSMLDREKVARSVMLQMRTTQADSTNPEPLQHPVAPAASSGRTRAGSLARSDLPMESLPSVEGRASSQSRPPSRREALESQSRSGSRARSSSQTAVQAPSVGRSPSVSIPSRGQLGDDGISGKPFVRVGTPELSEIFTPSSLPRAVTFAADGKLSRGQDDKQSNSFKKGAETVLSTPANRKDLESPGSVNVPVGVSRLHEVSLPALQMKPIYWSPVNDLAAVVRATWFYRDTMMPVDPTVANQLEAGYQELKPHSQTWKDEIRCAVEVGPLGEEKVSHPLWPKDPSSLRNDDGEYEPPLSSNPFCAARCFHGEVAAEGSLIPSAHEDSSSTALTHKKYAEYHVIYKDSTTAFLLKSSLKPSAYYGRRPVAKISKGVTIGIPVVRGFDVDVWTEIHQKKKAQTRRTSQPKSAASNSLESTAQDACPACKADKERGQVTDLVLVAHGIGQKFAERVESFHFTHAINAFRRAINLELGSDAVKTVLCESQNGIMVLPVNWRHKLSFEEGGPMKEEDKVEFKPEGFGLKDIEPDSIPAVRSMISDVMFDIPFYMSHHKPKMISALIGEANRVYRLWCRNNPGFTENGRVHLIGHSLGSAMALEILSNQPTLTPKLDLTKELELNAFEFNTRNLFLLGSPAAFFLLLERGALLPRRGRTKPGADPADVMSTDIGGEPGLFGCLAVDNIYNILAKEDAVAYLLNGTVDAKYAAGLKTAHVPSAATSWYQSVGSAVKGVIPGVGTSAENVNSALAKPPTVRLPSQLELEVHDFTREEIAEKKVYLLNDNGQIDYYLRSGGGPLELQYLSMFSAHTSYWTNQDLIRMLCMEIGRKPGKAHTLPAMRAQKASKRTLPASH